jgi:hypothetical protein
MSQAPADRAALPPQEIARIASFVTEWYRALDEHAPAAVLEAMVADTGLEFVVPEATLRNRQEFGHWYAGGNGHPGVINIFFDELHTVTSVEPAISNLGVHIDVAVNWQLRRWRPPAPRSQWLGFDAFQSWDLVPGPGPEGFLVKRYVVNELRPMPGSPSLDLPPG